MVALDAVEAVLHVGFHKTGTTALQTAFFPAIPGYACLARSGPAATTGYRTVSDHLRLAPDGEYREAEVRAFLEEAAGATGALAVSDEGLSGTHWRPRSEGIRTAERLHRLLPRARVLIAVRRQDDMLRSLYDFHVQKGGYRSLAGFLEGPGPTLRLELDHLCYDTLVGPYQERFGAERVVVVAYRQLVDDTAGFLIRVSAALGLPAPASTALPVANPGLSPAAQRAMRVTNRLFRRSEFNPRPLVAHLPAAERLRGRMQRLVTSGGAGGARPARRDADRARLAPLVARYEQSNARLAALTGLPLAELGYPMPSLAAGRDGGG